MDKKFNDLLATARDLPADYEREKSKGAGYFGGRPNQERQAAAKFVATIANHIKSNKSQYHLLNPEYKNSNTPILYNKNIIPHLKNVLFGAFFLQAINVSGIYEGAWFTTAKNSALYSLCLQVFSVDALSDVPLEVQKTNLESLAEYINLFPQEKFYESRDNATVLAAIASETAKLEEKIQQSSVSSLSPA